MEHKGFLFDNDGVLIDSSKWHWLSWQLLMKEETAFTIEYSQFIDSFGKRNDRILHELFPKIPTEEKERWAERKEELFREAASGKITLLPGMEEFLKELQQRDIPRIIASSTPIANLKMFLHETVLGDYFSEFVSAEEVAHGKPAPDIFIEAAKRLGLQPSECIVIEDAPAGVQAGKEAGCFVVAIETTNSKENLTSADLIYPDATHLKKLL